MPQRHGNRPDYATAWALMAVAQAALKFYFNGRGDGASGGRARLRSTTTSRKHAARARVLTSEAP